MGHHTETFPLGKDLNHYHNQEKLPTPEWEKIIVGYILDRGLKTQVHSELTKPAIKRQPTEKMGEDMRTFFKEETQSANNHKKMYQVGVGL